MKYNFSNKVVVITGGGSGIGLVMGHAFAQAGAKVIILGRDKEKLKTAQKKIQAVGFCDYRLLDVSNIKQVQKVFLGINKDYARLDILVNCAGVYGPIGRLHENDISFWQEALKINLFGTVDCVHTALPFMLKQKKGKIINLSGGGAVQPFPNFSAYATSKAAVVRFTENIAEEYKDKNIQINAIAPGAINTTFLKQVLKAGSAKAGKDFYNKSVVQNKSGGDSPEVAAELVLFLCSPAAQNITGKLISAKWDLWQKWNLKQLNDIKHSSQYTLRRIDNKYFKAI